MDSFLLGGGFEVMFTVVFLLVLAVFIAVLWQTVAQSRRNSRAPRLTVPAVVTAKRTAFHRSGTHNHATGTTWYYATFEVESGDRIELPVSGQEYGQLAEGDSGRLTFQGTRYLDFVRNIEY